MRIIYANDATPTLIFKPENGHFNLSFYYLDFFLKKAEPAPKLKEKKKRESAAPIAAVILCEIK